VLIAVLSIAAGPWADGAEPFQPGKASDYPSHQTIANLKIAAVKYESDSETKPVFDKTNPNEYGILPVLLMMENLGDETIMLDRIRVAYQTQDRMQIEPMAPREIVSVRAPKRPNTGPSYPSPIPLPRKKNPLTKEEFETRAWAAKMLVRGETAHGFLYFNIRHRRNSILYITGIREGTKELFFLEVPIDSPSDAKR